MLSEEIMRGMRAVFQFFIYLFIYLLLFLFGGTEAGEGE